MASYGIYLNADFVFFVKDHTSLTANGSAQRVSRAIHMSSNRRKSTFLSHNFVANSSTLEFGIDIIGEGKKSIIRNVAARFAFLRPKSPRDSLPRATLS